MVALVKALAKADADYRANAAKWTRRLGAGQGRRQVDQGRRRRTCRRRWRSTRFPTLAGAGLAAPGSGGGAAKAMADTAAFLKEQGRVQEVKPTTAPSSPTTYVEKAMAQVGATAPQARMPDARHPRPDGQLRRQGRHAAGAGAGQPDDARRRLRRRARRLGLRQDHAAELHRRLPAAVERRDPARRPAGRRPRRRPRRRVPEARADAVAERARQRRVRPEAARRRPGRARDRVADEKLALVGLEDFARPRGLRALGRHAAARGHRPRAGQRPGGAADGRADGRARRAYARDRCRRSCCDVWPTTEQDGVLHHPLGRGGAVPGHAPDRDVPEPGPHRARLRRRAVLAPASSRTATRARSSRSPSSSACARRCSRSSITARPRMPDAMHAGDRADAPHAPAAAAPSHGRDQRRR